MSDSSSSSRSSDDPDFGEEDIKEQLKTEFEELAHFYGLEQVKEVWTKYYQMDEASREKWQDKVHNRVKIDEGEEPKTSDQSQLEYEFVDLLKSYSFEAVTDTLREFMKSLVQKRLTELRKKMDDHTMVAVEYYRLDQRVSTIRDQVRKGDTLYCRLLDPAWCSLCDYCGKPTHDSIVVQVMKPEENMGYFHQTCFDKARGPAANQIMQNEPLGKKREAEGKPEEEPDKKKKKK